MVKRKLMKQETADSLVVPEFIGGGTQIPPPPPADGSGEGAGAGAGDIVSEGCITRITSFCPDLQCPDCPLMK